jgi:sugar lactone lactonase YvrE
LMIDGLALDVFGNAYVAVVSRNAVVRINAAEGSQETLAVYPGTALLDLPLSVAFGTGKGERENLFITNGGYLNRFVPIMPWPGPSLLKIDVGIPGQPLP